MNHILVSGFKINYHKVGNNYLAETILGDPKKNHFIIQGKGKKFSDAINEVANRISAIKERVLNERDTKNIERRK